MARSRLERSFGGDVAALSLDELREARAALAEEEVGLSYLRRLTQARLDIVTAAGTSDAGVAGLVEDLPSILADRTRPAGPGHLPRVLAPSTEEAERLARELDEVVAPGTFARVDELDEGARAELVARLTVFERDVSSRRRQVHERIDALQAELARRYRSGEADVGALLS